MNILSGFFASSSVARAAQVAKGPRSANRPAITARLVAAFALLLASLSISGALMAEARGLKPQAWAGEGFSRKVVSYTAVCQSGRLDNLNASGGSWCTEFGSCYRDKIEAAHASCGVSSSALPNTENKQWLVSSGERTALDQAERAEM